MTIIISKLKVVGNAPFGTVVGQVTALDEKGAVIPCDFMLTKQSAGYFGISSVTSSRRGNDRSNRVIILSRFEPTG